MDDYKLNEDVEIPRFDYVVDKVKLDKLKFVVLQELSKELVDVIANPSKVEVAQHSRFASEIMVRAVFEMLGREVERVECRWPADWWQAFKDRWFPEWAKVRWPVKESVRFLVARELYPKVKLPDREPFINLRVEG